MTKIAGAEDIFNATAEKVDSKDEKSDYKMAEADIPKYMEEHAGWKAVDDYTFVVEFTEPFGYALDLLAFPSFFPVNQKAYEEMGGYDKNMVLLKQTYFIMVDLLLQNGLIMNH